MRENLLQNCCRPLILVSFFVLFKVFGILQLFAIHFPSPPLLPPHFFALPLYFSSSLLPQLLILLSSPLLPLRFLRMLLPMHDTIPSPVIAASLILSRTYVYCFIMKNSPAQTRDRLYNSEKSRPLFSLGESAMTMRRMTTTEAVWVRRELYFAIKKSCCSSGFSSFLPFLHQLYNQLLGCRMQ